MQVLCIVALLLAAVAAHPDSWSHKQDEKLPTGGPNVDADSAAVPDIPEDGNGGSGGHWPEWGSGHKEGVHEMPTWTQHRPSGRPENGDSWGPMNGTDGDGHQRERHPQTPTRGKRQVPGLVDQPGSRHSGHFGKSKDSSRGRWKPRAMDFSPMFKVDSVTFKNVTDVTLKEGENLFLMPKHGERRPRHGQGGRHGPPKNGQYVKLTYNATEPNKVAIEYGVVKPMALGEMTGDEEEDPEENY